MLTVTQLAWLVIAAIAALVAGICVCLYLLERKRRLAAIPDGVVETDAVVTRVDRRRMREAESGAPEGERDYVYSSYVTFTNAEGETVERLLSVSEGKYAVGDRVRIAYLPDDPKLSCVYTADHFKRLLWHRQPE